MKVAIFYDDSISVEVEKIKKIIIEAECDVVSYSDAMLSQLRSKMESPHFVMNEVTHVLFMYQDNSLKHAEFVFFAGYASGKKIPIILFSDIANINLPLAWRTLFIVMEATAFATYFEEEKKNFLCNEEKELAKKKLLEKGYSLFTSNYVQVVKNNEIEVAKLFIDAGFSPSEKDALGTPVLSLAVRERHIGMVELLLAKGALVDATSKDRNYTALMDAAQIGEMQIAKILLEHGANPNTQSKDGQTALILAVGRQDVQVIDILLKASSDYTIKDCMGMSALDYANLFRNKEILALFDGK